MLASHSALVSAGIKFIFFLVPNIFLPTSLYLVQCCVLKIVKNNVDNSVMLWLLLSSAYSKPRTFQFLMFCQLEGAQETEREHGQDS